MICVFQSVWHHHIMSLLIQPYQQSHKLRQLLNEIRGVQYVCHWSELKWGKLFLQFPLIWWIINSSRVLLSNGYPHTCLNKYCFSDIWANVMMHEQNIGTLTRLGSPFCPWSPCSYYKTSCKFTQQTCDAQCNSHGHKNTYTNSTTVCMSLNNLWPWFPW